MKLEISPGLEAVLMGTVAFCTLLAAMYYDAPAFVVLLSLVAFGAAIYQIRTAPKEDDES